MQLKRIETSLVFLGQFLILAGLVYAAWHFGGVSETPLLRIAITSVVLLVIAGFVSLIQAGRHPASYLLPLIGCVLLSYAVVTGGLGSDELEQRFASPTIDAINTSIAKLESTDHKTTAAPLATDRSSLLPRYRSMEAMVPLTSGIAFLFAASVFFRDSRSRVVFAIVIVGNAMALTCWGFIQRSGENEFLLPGVLHSSDTIPFASFIYKNAGAAWMIPAIAIVATALLKGKTFRWHNDSPGVRRSRAGYGSASGFFEVSNLVLISAAMFLAAGLVISLCRGAWLAVGIAVVTGFLVDRRLQINRTSVIGLAVGAVAVVGLLVMVGGEDVARSRAADVTINRVVSDQRWSHWPDGWNTAIANLPFGSGLGTYRYATLPYQESVHKSWFLHAHNQYLETFTELGVVGVMLLLFAIAWTGRHCVQLIRSGQDTSSRRWGMIGLMVLVAGGVQSMIDFVLVIPANAYLYAAVIGITVGCSPIQKQPHGSTAATSIWDWLPGWKTSAAVVSMAIVLAIASLQFCMDHVASRQVLAATRTDQLDGPPPAADIDRAIESLDQAMQRRWTSSQVLGRRSTWQTIKLRSALLDLAKQAGEPIAWKATSPQRLFTVFNSVDPRERDELVQRLIAAPEITEALVRSLSDLRSAIAAEPCIAQHHIKAAFLSPISGMRCDSVVDSIGKLSCNSHRLLYNGGLIAYFSNRPDAAIQQWSRSLDINKQHIEPIFDLSVRRYAPGVIASRLVPASRLDLTLRLLQSIPADQMSKRSSTAAELIAAVESRNDLDTDQAWAWIARIHQQSDQHDLAAEAWRNAVASNGRSRQHRYQLAVSLRRCGRIEAAMDQALLGAAIGHDNERFERLVALCRSELAKESQKVRTVSRSQTSSPKVPR